MLVQFCWKLSRGQQLAFAIGAFLVGCGLISDPASAQEPASKPVIVQVQQKVVDWAGFGWGVGIATNFDVGGKRVNSATVVNNVVRVEDSTANVGVSFVLEAHYFLKDTMSRGCSEKGTSPINCTERAWGPFVALEVGGGSSASPAANGPITGYALGWMLGMRHPSPIPDIAPATSSWNIGIGLRVSPNGKVLGDGIVANQALAAGDTIRYKLEPRYGVMLLSTFSY
jgi:hypothetical protein